MESLRIRSLSTLDPADLMGLIDVLMDCVQGGASVSFMWPMTREKAEHYWNSVASSLACGERVVIVAEDESGIVGTAQCVWAAPENQPHRADVAKMLVHRRARRKGVGAALLRAVEEAARAAGKSVLVLDTASAEAERLYERCGWQRCGRIPDFALMPDGSFCDTVVYYKLLSASAA